MDRNPDLLDDLSPGTVERGVEALDLLLAEGIVCADRDGLPVPLLVGPLPKGMVGLTAGPPRPHEPFGTLALGQVVTGRDAADVEDLLPVGQGPQGIAR